MPVISAKDINCIKFSEAELTDYVNSVIKKDNEAETLNLLIGHVTDNTAKVLHIVPIQGPAPEDNCPKGSLALDDNKVNATIEKYRDYVLLGIMHHHCYETEKRPAEVTKSLRDKKRFPVVCMPGWGDVYTEIYENAMGFEHAKLARVIIGTSKDSWLPNIMPVQLFAYSLKEDCKEKETQKLKKKMENRTEFTKFTERFTDLGFLREETEKLYDKGLDEKIEVIETKPRQYYVEIRRH